MAFRIHWLAALGTALVHGAALATSMTIGPMPARAGHERRAVFYTVEAMPGDARRWSGTGPGFDEQPWPSCRDRTLDRLPQLVKGDDDRLEFVVDKPTVLCATVGADGRVQAAWVLESSGNEAVDKQAQSRAIERLRFTPAQRGGRSVTSLTWIRVDGEIQYYGPVD